MRYLGQEYSIFQSFNRDSSVVFRSDFKGDRYTIMGKQVFYLFGPFNQGDTLAILKLLNSEHLKFVNTVDPVEVHVIQVTGSFVLGDQGETGTGNRLFY